MPRRVRSGAAINRLSKRGLPRNKNPLWLWLCITAFALFVIGFFPFFYSFELHNETDKSPAQPFPVSVDPAHKKILENPQADALFTHDNATLSAAVIEAKGAFGLVASAIASLPFYKALGIPETRFVTIYPGYRKEQVANAFGMALGWDSAEKQSFLALASTSDPALTEGMFVPDTYALENTTETPDVEKLLADKFQTTILSRYGTSTAAAVPLDEALTIASLIERETSDPEEMRTISGIIWNRMFNGMNLQIDASVQYAKADANSAKSKNPTWWPQLTSNDKYIKSPYNTYANEGLPPTPISNPSIAAVIAALNPVQTDCLFYFHDKNGGFHCSATYAEHVALLKKYYGPQAK